MRRGHSLFVISLIAIGTLVGCNGRQEMKVTGVNPSAGHVAGDQTVEIRGANFRKDIGYTVYFGTAKAKSLTIRDSDALVVTTPAGSPGSVDVVLRADDGNSFIVKDGFRYEDMAGSVIEGLGTSGERKQKGNLAF